MLKKESFNLLGADFDAAYKEYANKRPEVSNSRIRPKGMDFFDWLSGSKRKSNAQNI
jgi:hypothetical protein